MNSNNIPQVKDCVVISINHNGLSIEAQWYIKEVTHPVIVMQYESNKWCEEHQTCIINVSKLKWLGPNCWSYTG